MNFIKIIYNAVIAIIAAVAILFIISVLPIPGGIRTLVVMSGSMEPTIKTGSVIVIKPAANYKTGDIITFGAISKTSMPTTHRIVDTKVASGQQVFFTKGDANDDEDAKQTPLSDIKGKVLFSIPYLGYGVNFVKKPLGFFLLFVLPLIVAAFDEIYKICKELRKSKNAPAQDKKE